MRERALFNLAIDGKARGRDRVGRCVHDVVQGTQVARRAIGLDPATYGTHSLRRSKATLIYRRTRNLRVVQLLVGHTKLASTVRYPGMEVDDALEIAEQTEVYPCWAGNGRFARRSLTGHNRTSVRGPESGHLNGTRE